MEIYPYWYIFIVPMIMYIFGFAPLIIILYYGARIAAYDYLSSYDRIKFLMIRGGIWFLVFYALNLFSNEVIVTKLLLMGGVPWLP